MERKRLSLRPQQYTRYYQLAVSVSLVVINCAMLICYFEIYNLLFRPSVHFWIYFITGTFIVTKIFMVFAFYWNTTILVDATLFLCVILLIFQFLWGLIATFSIVINADTIADNITAHFPEDKIMLQEMKEFEEENNCCFKQMPDNTTVTANPSLNLTSTEHSTAGNKPSCKSCIRVNKEKARNIAVFLITGYILIFIGLTTTILLIIFEK